MKTIGTYKVHPAADEFPMLSVDELNALAEDIRRNGLRHPIVLDTNGWILDGRNRLTASTAAGVKARFETYKGNDPIGFVVSTNIHRRHLNESQRADIAAGIANLKIGERKGKGKPGADSPIGEARKVSQADAAALLNVGKRSVERAAFVRAHAAPEVRQAVRDGRMAGSAAAELAALPMAKQKEIAGRLEDKKEIKSGNVRALVRQENRREVVRRINLEQVPDVPRGAFRLVMSDFPWPYENSDDHAGARGHIHYPPMPISDICAMSARVLPSMHEQHIHLMWVTNPFIWSIGKICDAWDLRQHSMITWAKDKIGMGPTWPRSQTEHCVIAARGVPTHTLNEISTLLEAAVREHSRKPDEIYAIAEKHCAGPYLELFAREPREGWVTWGAEADKFAPVQEPA